ncbi:SMC family ATPase, partial [Candidatus Berkelbacteria bacterium]|nr:SMC family ATPase [Candidatus Berkelbacteria bacterium]
MWTEFIFEHEGGVYRIVRRRVRKSRGGETTLEFQVKNSSQGLGSSSWELGEWRSLTEGTIRLTQEKIVSTLRLPYEIFVNSSYLRQGHADEFTIKTPAERKALLAEILGLSLYDTLEERAREKVRHAQSRLELLKLQTEELKSQLAERPEIKAALKTSQQNHDEISKTLVTAIKNLEKLNDDRLQFEKINQQLELERNNFATLQEQIKQLMEQKDATARELRGLQESLTHKDETEATFKEYQTIKKRLDTLSHKLMVAQKIEQELAVGESKQNDLVSITKRLSELKHCPTCLRPLPKIEAEKIIKALEVEFGKTTGSALTELKASLAKLGFSQDEYTKLQARYRELDRVVGHMQELKVAQTKISEKERFVASLEHQVVTQTKQLAEITASGRKLKLEQVKFDQAARMYNEEQTRLNELQSQKSALERALGGLQEQVNRIKEQETKSSELAKELTELQGETQSWQALALAFSKKGIPAMIIEQSLPAIEQEANVILGRLSDGRLKVAFETQRAKKTPLRQGSAGQASDVIETLDIIVSDELGERAYELFSGGEGFRINFAIRVAISKLLSMRVGAKLKFLVIDEGFGMLDMAGQQDIIAAINAIREDFAKVIVVSHIDSIKDAFQTRIEVSKGAHGSEILTNT